MNFAVFIPCRLESKRLPNKPLRKIAGRALLEWTVERAMESDAKRVYVVCDAEKIGASVNHPKCHVWYVEHGNTGTHRLSLAAIPHISKYDRIVNLQVDEPFVNPEDLNRLGSVSRYPISTLIGDQIFDTDYDPHVVKAVVDPDFQQCQWFSRYYMGPYCYAHVGVYSYTPEALRAVGPLQTPISKETSLEQLAWLENGHQIHALHCTGDTPLSVNTESDLYLMESRLHSTR